MHDNLSYKIIANGLDALNFNAFCSQSKYNWPFLSPTQLPLIIFVQSSNALTLHAFQIMYC